jgi:hypothetical protein
MIEKNLITILAEVGPLTGAQLVERSHTEVLSLWQTCRRAKPVRLINVGRRFLRLDRHVHGYARLSPSIRREFLTYTLVGLDSQRELLETKAEALRRQTKQISQEKRDIARESIVSAVAPLAEKDVILEKACFIIAGDAVYDMSHLVSRPEKSTGEMVRGSDLDIVVITEDDLSGKAVEALDKAIYKKKYLLLVNDREEIDYLIKSFARVQEQLKFDIFSSQVACKILDEGLFLYGSPAVFRKLKDLIEESGIPARLRSMEQQAAESRELAEAQLLEVDTESDRSEYLNLFYTHAEEDEIY